MNAKAWTWLLMIVLLSGKAFAFEAAKTEINTADILSADFTDSSCHHYCWTGACIWLECSPVGCSINTTLRVSHYNPDLVVSVYDEPGDNPWQEAEALFGRIEEQLTASLVGIFHDAEPGGGHGTEGGSEFTDSSLRFKEATAIGHPLTSLVGLLGGANLFCPSEAWPFTPHFSSGVDALSWRLDTAEMFYPQNLLPGRRVVGQGGFFQQWGPVWPRTGFVKQKDDVKAAAVVAQRVGNIVTQLNQPHIYWPLYGNGFNRTWLPGELIENDDSTGVWQMLAPREDGQCYAFGENDVLQQSWSAGRQSEDNRYAFVLWRPYECCRARGSLISTVNFRLCL